ncbi:unnamed protein product, partial [Porites lobata]
MQHPHRFLFFLEEVSFREAVIVFSLCPLTVTLNATVILVICKDPYKELRGTAANFFILNLAVCDLLIGFPGELLFGLRHWFPDNPTLIQAGSESTKSSCILLDLEPLKHSIEERTMVKDTLALL